MVQHAVIIGWTERLALEDGSTFDPISALNLASYLYATFSLVARGGKQTIFRFCQICLF